MHREKRERKKSHIINSYVGVHKQTALDIRSHFAVAKLATLEKGEEERSMYRKYHTIHHISSLGSLIAFERS